jgi:ABC-type dipeptide/oligopeptide/nickel transport system ATPase component
MPKHLKLWCKLHKILLHCLHNILFQVSMCCIVVVMDKGKLIEKMDVSFQDILPVCGL